MSKVFSLSTLSVIVIGILVAAAVWYGMSQSSSGSTSAIATQPSATSLDDKELVETLLALRAVTLDGTIFNEPAFLSLKDFGTQIVPEPAGRPNPFAPLAGSGVSQAASPAAATPPPTKSASSTPPIHLPRAQQR